MSRESVRPKRAFGFPRSMRAHTVPAMNPSRCLSVFGLMSLMFALGLLASAQAADVFNSAYLSEFLADNQHGLQDDDGDRSGWIELHNGGGAPVNLAGWFLTDTPTNLAKWRFPGVVLLPDKYLIVFASAKDRTKDLAHLHANFRLAKHVSYLALVNPATNVISEFPPGIPRGKPS